MDAARHTPRRRALIIGVNYEGTDWGVLSGQQDAERFNKFLVGHRGWHEDEITVMLDKAEGDGPAELRPTQENIKREITSLTAGAKSEDHFVFFYAGHSDQLPCKGSSEEDGMDEVIVPCDCDLKLNRAIIDNELKRLLVDPLPVGSSLTAIFDSCHSGTLLDLPHYHCNAVYVPWVSKGKRQADTLRNGVGRRLARASALASNKTKFSSLPRSALRSPLSRMALSPMNARGRAPWQHIDSPVPSTFGSPAYGSPAYGSPAYGSPAYGSPSYVTPAFGSPLASVVASAAASPVASPPSASPQHTLVPHHTPAPIHGAPHPPRAPSPKSQATLLPPRAPSPQATLMPGRRHPAPQRTVLPPPQNPTCEVSDAPVPVNGYPSSSVGRARPRRPTLKTVLAALEADPSSFAHIFGQRCASPEPIPGSDCDGWCNAGSGATAHVVALSACADQERAWEDWTGETMTSALIGILTESPNCSYDHLLTHLSHRLHKTSRNLHRWTRDYKRQSRTASAATTPTVVDENKQPGVAGVDPDPGDIVEEPYEMDNFQNPQLSSHERLNLKETFRL